MVLELDTGRCDSKDGEPQRGVDTERCASEDAGHQRGEGIVRSYIDWSEERVPRRTLSLEGGWIVRSHIGWGGERNTLYKGAETSL